MTTSLLTSTTTPDTDLDLDLDLDLNAATDTNDPRITAEVEQVIDRLEALASEQENLQAQLAVLRDERDRLILRGLAYGMSSSELATRARLTGARVRAIADAAYHTHLLGPTGAGKSTVMLALALADAAQGRGLLLIDPKGDLATDFLARLPEQRPLMRT